jgi:replication factor C subunit 3/5
MEKYSKTTRFCLICNYVNKVIPALVSRCTRFKFKQIPTADSSRRIKQICTAEGLPLDDGAITAVIAQAEGDMRRAVNLLQSIRLSLNVNKTPGTITEDYVFTLTGTLSPAQMTEILRTLLTKPVSEAYSFISRIQEEQGVGLATIIKDLLPLIVDYSSPVGWKPFLITRLAEIEFRLSHNCSEKIQLGSLVGAFFEVRTLKITSEPIRA